MNTETKEKTKIYWLAYNLQFNANIPWHIEYDKESDILSIYFIDYDCRDHYFVDDAGDLEIDYTARLKELAQRVLAFVPIYDLDEFYYGTRKQNDYIILDIYTF